MDFSTTCRICLSKERITNLKSVKNSIFDNMCYEELIFFCTGINLSDDSQIYPSSICCKCEEHLLQSYRFKKRLIEANHELENMSFFNKSSDIENVTVKSKDDVNRNIHLEKNNDSSQDSHYESNSSEFFSIHDIMENSTIDETVRTTKHKTKKKNFCHRCNASFCNIKEFDLHRKTYHARSRGNLCLVCGILTQNKYHAETHKDPSEKFLFNCSVCNKTYTTQGNLNSHMRSHTHPNELRYKCRYCEKKFRSCSTRNYHLIRDHEGKAKFSCSICGKAFIKLHQYTLHMMSHTGERPHKCELCDMSFKTATQLRNHMITHTKERNHKCETCQKKFARRRSLREHMKIHTGEKNYICPVCSEAFMQNHVMRAHATKKHPNYDLPPPGTIISQKAIKKNLLT